MGKILYWEGSGLWLVSNSKTPPLCYYQTEIILCAPRPPTQHHRFLGSRTLDPPGSISNPIHYQEPMSKTPRPFLGLKLVSLSFKKYENCCIFAVETDSSSMRLLKNEPGPKCLGRQLVGTNQSSSKNKSSLHFIQKAGSSTNERHPLKMMMVLGSSGPGKNCLDYEAISKTMNETKQCLSLPLGLLITLTMVFDNDSFFFGGFHV